MSDLASKRALPGDHPKRRWKPEHRAAGYHLQEWGWKELHEAHEICGDYACMDGSLLTIRFLKQGHTNAPELELDWENGPTLTVLDAAVAENYLQEHGATKLKGGKP